MVKKLDKDGKQEMNQDSKHNLHMQKLEKNMNE